MQRYSDSPRNNRRRSRTIDWLDTLAVRLGESLRNEKVEM